MALRRSSQRLRLFGIGTKDSERHRESKFARHLDGIKIIFVTGGIMALGVGGMMLMRRLQILIDPKTSSLSMHQKMDSVLFENPQLSVALTQMAFHHVLSGCQTPFATPMVCPPHLIEEAQILENLMGELVQYKHGLSPADLWAILCVKALQFVGGPTVSMKVGRPLDETSMKVKIIDPIIPHTKRNAKALKDEMGRNGYRVSDVVAIVGASRCLGYHPDVKFNVKDNVEYRKTTTQPLIFGNDYFDELVHYQWTPESQNRKDKKKLFGLFSQKTSSGSDDTSPDLYRCNDDRKAALRVKYMIPNQAPKAPMTEHEAAAAEEQKPKTKSDPSASVCSQISMQGIDIALLDDSLLSGWVNRFADNEQTYFTQVEKIYDDLLQKGYDKTKLNRRFAS